MWTHAPHYKQINSCCISVSTQKSSDLLDIIRRGSRDVHEALNEASKLGPEFKEASEVVLGKGKREFFSGRSRD